MLNNENLIRIKKSIKEGMVDFMDDDTEYTQSDIDKCIQILDTFTVSISESEDIISGMRCVEKAVLELNVLNENVDEELIETGQREEICEYIIFASSLLGYNDTDEDITEEWREW